MIKQERTYFVLRVGDRYWTGWNYTPNIRSARRYDSRDELVTDARTHSFELDGVTEGTLVEVREELAAKDAGDISWKGC